MNFLPLLGFLLAVAWIIRQGYIAKKEYTQRQKPQKDLQQGTAESTGGNLRAETLDQGRRPEPTELAGLGPSRQRETRPTWN